MKTIARFLAILFLVLGAAAIDSTVMGEEANVELPWNYKGYMNLGQFHLRYYYVFGYAIEAVFTGEKNWDESIKDNTGIAEVWFSKDKNMLRVDRYIENLGVRWNSFEGAPPATISYNGTTYSLYDRTIQKGLKTTRYTFNYRTQTDYDYEKSQAIVEGGYYEKYDSEAYKEPDPEWAISLINTGHESRSGFTLYAPKSMDTKDLETAGFGLMKMMQPARHDKILEGWKVKENIAGRPAVKNYNSPPFFWGADGYQFIDKELGIGLAGYLEGCRASDTYKEMKFSEPKLVYEALIVDTSGVPSDVFENF